MRVPRTAGWAKMASSSLQCITISGLLCCIVCCRCSNICCLLFVVGVAQGLLKFLELSGKARPSPTPRPIHRTLCPQQQRCCFQERHWVAEPSELLLHCNYGAAVKCWGHGKEVLQNCIMPPCPPVPVPAQMEPSTTIHDRSITIRKCDAPNAGSSSAGAGTGELIELEGWTKWDEDNWMSFFWGDTKTTKDCHLKKVQENTQHMEQWREGVSH